MKTTHRELCVGSSVRVRMAGWGAYTYIVLAITEDLVTLGSPLLRKGTTLVVPLNRIEELV